jgi:ribosomal protein S13
LAYFKFKKGDLVIVDNDGSPSEFEIVSPLLTGIGKQQSNEICYDAKEVNTGQKRTISEDEILRLATPVDNSARLFPKKDS